MPKDNKPITPPGGPREPDEADGIFFSRGKKFDLQLSAAVRNERRLAKIFTTAKIEKVELKSEMWLWEKTGNICIEFRYGGKPSGIAITDADYWVHELRRRIKGEEDGYTLVYLMFPVMRLKQICRAAYREGHWRTASGDDGKSDVVLLSLKDIIREVV